MPELPEVETVRRGLAERVIGDRIESVWLSGKPQTFKSRPSEIAEALQGARIADVQRMGKHIVVCLNPNAPKPGASRTPLQRGARNHKSEIPAQGKAEGCANSPLQWIVHLGMTGALQVTAPEADVLKHTHAILHLASGREVRFVDPRRFGRMWVTADFATPGAEPLHIGFEEFASLFRGRKTPIKSALLNQKLLRGLGNIYADESLFRAGIRPRRQATSLTREELRRLHAQIKKVLREAITAGGSSISDYFDVAGERGLFQTKHRVYGRTGEPCLICRSPVKRVVVAGRSTHYCASCQK